MFFCNKSFCTQSETLDTKKTMAITHFLTQNEGYKLKKPKVQFESSGCKIQNLISNYSKIFYKKTSHFDRLNELKIRLLTPFFKGVTMSKHRTNR